MHLHVLPSALQVLFILLKYLWQLHLWEPFVLLQMWEQTPNCLHSFLSVKHPKAVTPALAKA